MMLVICLLQPGWHWRAQHEANEPNSLTLCGVKKDALVSYGWNGSYQMLSGSIRLIRRYQLTYKQDVQLW